MPDDISKRKVRVAMIGGGPGSFIADIRLKAMLLDGQIEIVAGAFSSDPERSRQQGEKLFLDPARVYGSWQDMLAREAERRDKPDFICIVTPNHLHFEPARQALEHGFHVALDKPMTMNLDEAVALRDAVAESGKLFALTHTYAANAMIKVARDLIKQGYIGRGRKIVVEYPQGWLYRKLEDSNKQAFWRTNPALAGAGAVGDIGTHACNLSETVSGLRVTDVAADVGTVVEGRLLEDDFTALARWEGGVRGSIQASQISTGEGNGLAIRVYGDKAGLQWRHSTQEYLTIMHQDKPWERWARGAPYIAQISRSAARISRTDQDHPEGYIEEFANIYLPFARAIRSVEQGQTPDPLDLDFPNVEDGVRGMAFIQAALESGRNNSAWIAVPKR